MLDLYVITRPEIGEGGLGGEGKDRAGKGGVVYVEGIWRFWLVGLQERKMRVWGVFYLREGAQVERSCLEIRRREERCLEAGRYSSTKSGDVGECRGLVVLCGNLGTGRQQRSNFKCIYGATFERRNAVLDDDFFFSKRKDSPSPLFLDRSSHFDIWAENRLESNDCEKKNPEARL